MSQKLEYLELKKTTDRVPSPHPAFAKIVASETGSLVVILPDGTLLTLTNILSAGSILTASLADESVTAPKIEDNAVTASKLSQTLIESIRSATVVVTDNEDGTATAEIQLIDAEGNALSEAFVARVWISAAALGAPADLGVVTFEEGLELQEIVEDEQYIVASTAGGLIEIGINATSNGPVTVNVALGASVVSDTESVTGNV